MVQAVDPEVTGRRGALDQVLSKGINSIQGDSVRSHSHSISPSQINGIVRGFVGGGYSIPGGGNVSANNAWDFKIGEFGGSETRPINIYVNYIIKH